MDTHATLTLQYVYDTQPQLLKRNNHTHAMLTFTICVRHTTRQLLKRHSRITQGSGIQ